MGRRREGVREHFSRSGERDLLAQVREDEGFRGEAYLDTLGVWTIGYGSTTRLDGDHRVREGDRITMEAAEAKLRHDLDTAWSDLLAACPWAAGLPGRARAGLLMASFQMGIGRLLGFRKMLEAARRARWREAALECVRGGQPGTVSRWFRQTPIRAVRVAAHFIACEWERN